MLLTRVDLTPTATNPRYGAVPPLLGSTDTENALGAHEERSRSLHCREKSLMKIRTLRLGAFAALAFSVVGCSRDLSRDEARRVIEQNTLIRPTDKVSIDAISSTSSAEAIVRATVAGQTTNLKFRRFDTGWTWEFIETKAGGWVAPDVAVGQIREEHRIVAAIEWATRNEADYAATAKTLNLIAMYDVQNPKELENPALVAKLRQMMVDMAKKRAKDEPNSDWPDRLAVLTNDHVKDAWGSEILASFGEKQAILTSIGPDKQQRTDDDLLCLVNMRPGFENGRSVWHQDKSWKLPEGLGSAVEKFADRPYGTVEFSKVVKP